MVCLIREKVGVYGWTRNNREMLS